VCQESFNRAVIQANQFLKHDRLADAKEALKNAHRYNDSIPENGVIIAGIQHRIAEKEQDAILEQIERQASKFPKWVFESNEGIDNGN